MILGIIATIFSLLGIYGYFSGNTIFLYIGLSFVIVEHIVGIVSGKQKSLSTVWIALLFAIGMIFAGVNWIQAIAVCLCFESTICFFAGLLVIFFIRKSVKSNKEKYIKLSNIVMKSLNTSNIEEAIKKATSFYKEQGINVDEINFSSNDPQIILCEIIMHSLDVDNIDDAIAKTIEFYKEQGIDLEE